MYFSVSFSKKVLRRGMFSLFSESFENFEFSDAFDRIFLIVYNEDCSGLGFNGDFCERIRFCGSSNGFSSKGWTVTEGVFLVLKDLWRVKKK